jgi:hypothetical protein
MLAAPAPVQSTAAEEHYQQDDDQDGCQTHTLTPFLTLMTMLILPNGARNACQEIPEAALRFP